MRVRALRLLEHRPDRATLLALTDVLNDSSPVDKREYGPQLQPGYPLANSTTLLALRPALEWQYSRSAKTIG